ncbi:MAG: hypothetical protein JW904_06815 [Spirochaetales bacterium]|nr:hypothetical protein [Spirochaetales bacterium]
MSRYAIEHTVFYNWSEAFVQQKIVFVFLDGFGLGQNSPDNPVVTFGNQLFTDFFPELPDLNLNIKTESVTAIPLDAACGVPGIPQSATGQTTLFTGINAAKEIGFHLPAFPNHGLVEIIHHENIHLKIKNLGRKPVFANAYSDHYFNYIKEKNRRFSVTTHCVFGADIPFLMIEDLLEGNALCWDITREAFQKYKVIHSVPVINGKLAGKHLAGITNNNDFVLFESFKTDLIGHKQDRVKAELFLAVLKDFFSALKKNIEPKTSIVICSDHGNFEDLSTGMHTTNPVGLYVFGPAAPFFHDVKNISEVTPRIVNVMSEE